MTNSKRDDLIIEMHTDIKWLIGNQTAHKKEHVKYMYYFLTSFIAIGLSWFR